VRGFNSFHVLSCRTPPGSHTPVTPLSRACARSLSPPLPLPLSLSLSLSLSRALTHTLSLSLFLSLSLSHSLAHKHSLLTSCLPLSLSFDCTRMEPERHTADRQQAAGRQCAHASHHLEHSLPESLPPVRCRANMAHIRQSRPDYGLGFQAKVTKKKVVPSMLGRCSQARSHGSPKLRVRGPLPSEEGKN